MLYCLVTLPALDQRLDEIRSKLKNDDTLKTVMQYVQNGGPEECGNISLHSGLLLRGQPIIIPPRLRADMYLGVYMMGHQGITKT